MAQKLAERIKRELGRSVRVEGLPVADWVLIDADDVIVHIFRPEVRSFYNLERMWAFEERRRRRRRPSCGDGTMPIGLAAWSSHDVMLHIVARGKIGRGPEAELVERYLKRIAWPVKVTELPESGGRPPPPRRERRHHPARRERRAAGLARACAKRLERWRDDGRREARFLIGGADGFDDAERGRRRPAARLRPGDLAAPARPGDARRAIVARHRASLPTTPIIAKDSGMRHAPSPRLDAAPARGGRPARMRSAAATPTALAEAPARGGGGDAAARSSSSARRARATGEADRARAEAAALAARIEAAEADITAAERADRADRARCRRRSAPASPRGRGR